MSVDRRDRSRSAGRRRRHNRDRSLSPNNHAHRDASPPPPRMAPAPASDVVGVFGLKADTTEAEVRRLFRTYGEISRVSMVYDRKTNLFRGFCFVYFNSIENARSAISGMNGQDVSGRRIRVDFSETRRPHSPTPGFYHGSVLSNDTRTRDRSEREPYDNFRNGHSRESRNDRDGHYSRESRHDRNRNGHHDRRHKSPERAYRRQRTPSSEKYRERERQDRRDPRDSRRREYNDRR